MYSYSHFNKNQNGHLQYPSIRNGHQLKNVSSNNQHSSLIPFKHFQKIKKCNKKIISIQSGKSKELNNILLKYKIKRDLQLNFIEQELKHKLFKLRENAMTKQSIIIKEKEQQIKLLNKRIIKELQKIKERLQRNNNNNNKITMDEIKQEINEVFNDSVNNINHMSCRRITRNRAKSHMERRNNIDFTKYKFGLTPNEINLDLKYLMNATHTNHAHNIKNDSVSIGFTSHPMGFLNDRHLLASQLTGMNYKTRSKRITADKSRRIIKEMIGNENNYNENHDIDMIHNNNNNNNGQICVFEKADEIDKDYVMNDHGVSENDEMLKNAVFINGVRFTSGDKIRIIQNGIHVNGNGDNVKCGIIKCVMKYHMKVIIHGQNRNNNKPKRIRYKDINQGLFSVFLQTCK